MEKGAGMNEPSDEISNDSFKIDVGNSPGSGNLMEEKLDEAVPQVDSSFQTNKIDNGGSIQESIQAIQNLPYYDFVLLGESEVGKTTYLAMMCEEGGAKNPEWDFTTAGLAEDLSINAPDSIIENRDEFSNKVSKASAYTARYIQDIRQKIQKEPDKSYSTQDIQEMVFHYRAPGSSDQRTLLTVDYRGETIYGYRAHGKAHDEDKLEDLLDHINRSQALLILLDYKSFFEDDSFKLDAYAEALTALTNKLRSKKYTRTRFKDLVQIRKLPVCIVINKSDYIWKQFLAKQAVLYLKSKLPTTEVSDLLKNALGGRDPVKISYADFPAAAVIDTLREQKPEMYRNFVDDYFPELYVKAKESGELQALIEEDFSDGFGKRFLKRYHSALYHSVKKLTKNWAVHFISCFGFPDSFLQYSDSSGNLDLKAEIPKRLDPIQIAKPIHWMFGQARKRVAIRILLQLSRLFSYIVLTCVFIYLYDYAHYSYIIFREPVKKEVPLDFYSMCQWYERLHPSAPWTGYFDDIRQKRKAAVEKYIDLETADVDSKNFRVNVEQIRDQVLSWTLEIAEEDFEVNINTHLKERLTEAMITYVSGFSGEDFDWQKKVDYEKTLQEIKTICGYTSEPWRCQNLGTLRLHESRKSFVISYLANVTKTASIEPKEEEFSENQKILKLAILNINEDEFQEKMEKLLNIYRSTFLPAYAKEVLPAQFYTFDAEEIAKRVDFLKKNSLKISSNYFGTHVVNRISSSAKEAVVKWMNVLDEKSERGLQPEKFDEYKSPLYLLEEYLGDSSYVNKSLKRLVDIRIKQIRAWFSGATSGVPRDLTADNWKMVISNLNKYTQPLKTRGKKLKNELSRGLVARHINMATPSPYNSKSREHYQTLDQSFRKIFKEFGLGTLKRSSSKEYSLFLDFYAKRFSDSILSVKGFKEFQQEKERFKRLFPGSTLVTRLNRDYAKRIYARIYNDLENENSADIGQVSRYVATYLKLNLDQSSAHYKSVRSLQEFISNTIVYVDSKGDVSPRKFKRTFSSFDTKEKPDSSFKILGEGKCVTYAYDSGLFKGRYKRRHAKCPLVYLKIRVDGKEVFNSGLLKEFSGKPNQNFEFQWLPGQTVKITLRNSNGGTHELESSGLLSINSLAGRLDFPDSSAYVRFLEKDLILPKFGKP
jgi:hypothetical protein